jgi:hypothetical protein
MIPRSTLHMDGDTWLDDLGDWCVMGPCMLAETHAKPARLLALLIAPFWLVACFPVFFIVLLCITWREL